VDRSIGCEEYINATGCLSTTVPYFSETDDTDSRMISSSAICWGKAMIMNECSFYSFSYELFVNIACQKRIPKCNMPQNIPRLIFPITRHTKPQNMNMNDHYDLQEHCEALFPYSTQRGVAKFVDSAQLNP
jgi:hypothetical protein